MLPKAGERERLPAALTSAQDRKFISPSPQKEIEMEGEEEMADSR